MTAAKLSPLMEQYYREKKQYPDALLLFRVGDFYETFAEDAVVVARDLNITLTSRQKDDEGNKIPLAGVPYHALEAYLAKLIKAGHKVAICDQVEDPKTAKGLVKREITRVVTPGTIIEPSMLEECSNNFLAAVVQEGDEMGLALVDVSTGEFLTTEIPADRLASELAKFRPAECIAPFSLELGRHTATGSGRRLLLKGVRSVRPGGRLWSRLAGEAAAGGQAAFRPRLRRDPHLPAPVPLRRPGAFE